MGPFEGEEEEEEGLDTVKEVGRFIGNKDKSFFGE